MQRTTQPRPHTWTSGTTESTEPATRVKGRAEARPFASIGSTGGMMEIAVADSPRRRGVRMFSPSWASWSPSASFSPGPRIARAASSSVLAHLISGSTGSIGSPDGSLSQERGSCSWPLWSAGRDSVACCWPSGGLAALASAAWALIATRAFYLTVASFTLAGGDFSQSEVRTQVERILDDFELAVRPGIGAWMVAGGGLVAILAAIFLRRPKQPQRTEEAPDEPHTAEPQREESVALQGTSAPRFPPEEPTRSDEEPDRTSPQDVKGSVWERSFDDAERTVDRIEDQPAAPPGADPEEDHTAGEAEEPPGLQRKDALGDSWVG